MQTKIVNFLSAKGGVGKSVIAANFAEILSEQGYRTAIIEAPNLNNQEIILNALQRKRISLPSAVAVKISQNLTLVSPALASQNPASSQNSMDSAQNREGDENLSSHNYAQKLTSSDGKNNSENSAASNSIREILKIKPEFEDCKAAALAHGTTIERVRKEALKIYDETRKTKG